MLFDVTDQEHNHILQLLINRPLGEALPLYLKLTGQKIVPDVNKQAGVTPQLVKPAAE